MSAITHTFRFSGAGEDFGPRSDGIITGHTWEGPYNALTVADGIEMLKWQDAGDVLGSYNRVCCVDGVISSVPDDHASGGINPGSSFWAPKAWLREHLSSEQINNPNYFALNLVALGRRSWFDVNGWSDEIIDGMARSWVDEEKRTGRRMVWTGHSDFQSNRSDCGPIATALVKKRYAELMVPVTEEDMPTLTTYALETIRIDAAAAIRGAPTTQGAPLFLSGRESSAVRVGTLVNAESEWSVYWLADRKRWGYTAKQNVLSVEPYQNTVEVPTGITPELLAQAKRLAFGRGRDEGAAAYTAAGTAAAKAVAP